MLIIHSYVFSFPTRIIRTMKKTSVPNMVIIKIGKKVIDRGCAVTV